MTISHTNADQLLEPGGEGGGEIIRVGWDRRVEAVQRLVAGNQGPASSREHARQFLDYANRSGVNLEAMWSRLDRNGQIRQTVLAVPSPGRTAMMFASHPLSAGQTRPLGGLIDHACRRLVDLDVNLAQVLLEIGESADRAAYRFGGFADLADLSYLERPLRGMRRGATPRPAWPAGASVVSYDESMRDVLLKVLEASYEETLDCPGLIGCRETADILEGHRSAGVFDPSLWTILYVDGEPSGALLLNPGSDHQTIELVYLGLVKRARGKGLGAQLLRHGLCLVEHRNERAVHLAVDDRNEPALRLYQREHFQPVLRRAAMIRPLRPTAR